MANRLSPVLTAGARELLFSACRLAVETKSPACNIDHVILASLLPFSDDEFYIDHSTPVAYSKVSEKGALGVVMALNRLDYCDFKNAVVNRRNVLKKLIEAKEIHEQKVFAKKLKPYVPKHLAQIFENLKLPTNSLVNLVLSRNYFSSSLRETMRFYIKEDESLLQAFEELDYNYALSINKFEFGKNLGYEVQSLMELGRLRAMFLGHKVTTSGHLMLALADHPITIGYLKHFNIDVENFRFCILAMLLGNISDDQEVFRKSVLAHNFKFPIHNIPVADDFTLPAIYASIPQLNIPTRSDSSRLVTWGKKKEAYKEILNILRNGLSSSDYPKKTVFGKFQKTFVRFKDPIKFGDETVGKLSYKRYTKNCYVKIKFDNILSFTPKYTTGSNTFKQISRNFNVSKSFGNNIPSTILCSLGNPFFKSTPHFVPSPFTLSIKLLGLTFQNPNFYQKRHSLILRNRFSPALFSNILFSFRTLPNLESPSEWKLLVTEYTELIKRRDLKYKKPINAFLIEKSKTMAKTFVSISADFLKSTFYSLFRRERSVETNSLEQSNKAVKRLRDSNGSLPPQKDDEIRIIKAYDFEEEQKATTPRLKTSKAPFSTKVIRLFKEAQDSYEVEETEIAPPLSPSLQDLIIDLRAEGLAGKIDDVIGRKHEMIRLFRTLTRRKKANPILLGDPGVGKTAIIEGLATRVKYQGDFSKLRDARIYSLNFGSLLSNTSMRGQFEGRIMELVNFISEKQNRILFIDEIHIIMGGSGNGEANSSSNDANAGNLLKPALARGDFKCIGATTLDEYRKFFLKDPALERRFQPITIFEPSIADTIKIVYGILHKYESHHQVVYPPGLVPTIVGLTVEYCKDRFLPDKAFDLLDEVGSLRRSLLMKFNFDKDKDEKSRPKESFSNMTAIMEECYSKLMLNNLCEYECLKKGKYIEAQMYRNKSKELLESNPLLALHVMEFLRDNRYVRHSDLLLIISEWTGVPMGKLSKTEAEKLLILEETLKKKVVGQDLAISAVTKALKRSRLGFKPVNKPIASFIFAGPTGVGKTELAKVIADQFFGTIKALVRLDMSEYMEQHSVSKLTGAPPGYVGYEEGGILTNKVRTQSHSVVLFDEIEKAHISIFDLLLQILDDGILTDNEGKQTFFDNSLVILTSNLGAKEVLKEKELRDDVNDKEIVLKVLKEYFRPEFLNRLDEVIVFSALNATYTEKITEMLLQKVVNSLSKKNIYVRLDFNVARHISSSIHDYNYGARPIRRAVTAQVEDALVNKMLQLRIDPKNSGGVKVNCLVVNNSLDFDFIS